MTLRFLDSFDDRSTVNSPYKWTSQGGSAPSISTLYGRYQQGMYIGNDGNCTPRLSLDTAQATWILGFACQSLALNYNTQNFLFFWDRSNGSNNYQLYVQFKNTKEILVYRGDGTLLLTTSASMVGAAWQHFEIKFTISNAAGSIEVRRNGLSIGSVAGVDTQNTGNAYCTDFNFQGGNSNEWFIDDLYLCDGSAGDTFRGDCRVECLRPTGAGDYTEFSPSAGANWQNVDDPYSSVPCPDGDTTYNSTAVVGERDSFTFGNLGTTAGDIEGVQIVMNMRKDNAGTRTVKPFVRQGAANFDGTGISVENDFVSHVEIQETNPATGVAWTIADINTNAQFGYKLEA